MFRESETCAANTLVKLPGETSTATKCSNAAIRLVDVCIANVIRLADTEAEGVGVGVTVTDAALEALRDRELLEVADASRDAETDGAAEVDTDSVTDRVTELV